ncbi:T9SS sorting signal type C domain-containing protein [Flavobacterium lindanitolerans]|uniref:T9SS sorting signal type C domain-containing protein n=2 Tax=Flavobacterium lindanitolerans TaxID=428988 RepID=UPI002806C021|nr:T9SS sorting signal type C domain-containing protein [Flavobacterium lindanitolerans]MDQ7961866.1 T9SS sorting signal type C domain-containing protein [Flavobacterium lindanitolerans]
MKKTLLFNSRTLMVLVFGLFFNLASGQTLVAGWTFDNTDAAPNTPKVVTANIGSQTGTATIYADGTNGSSNWLSTASNPELTSFAGSTVNDPRTTPNAGSAYSIANSSANTKKIILKVSMTGYENPVLSFSTRGTSTGFNTHQWAWSVDGIAFTNFGSNTAVTSTTFLVRTLDLSAINGVDNVANLYLRLTVSGASNNSGNNRLDNILIEATPTSTTWNGTAWSNGTPTSSLDAIIAGDYSTGAAAPQGAFTAKSLTVNSGIFTVASGTSVTVENAIVNNAASSNFIVENNANLIQTNAVANTGSIKVKRNSNPLYRFDYTLWSSPLIGQNLKGFSSATLSNRFYTYNTATGTNGDYEAVFPTQSEGSYNFESGKGYLIRTPDSHPAYVAGNPGTVINAEFTGVPYNQSVNVALSNANTGFNLVGNPYPSAISIAQLFSSNSDAIDGTIWFWRKRNGASGSGYATSTGMGVTSAQPEAAALNPNGVINAGQGFFVKVKSGATQNTLNFSNALRSATTGGAFFRNANTTEVERHRIWLNLSNGTEVVGQTLLGYMTGATSGVDYGIEGSYFNDSGIAFTSYIENKEFAIQGRSLPFTSDDVVPMSFKTDVAGNYTIAIDHVDGLFAGSQEVFLKDNTTGQLHNLKSGAYSFASETGVFNNRFEIVYRAALGVKVPAISSNNIVAYKQNGSLVINSGNYVMENIELYDMSGRLIYTKNNIDTSSAVIANLPIANQVLVVKITTAENGTANKKIVY